MKKTVFVPALSSKPCASRPSSIYIAFVQTSRRSGSLANFSYFVIVSFVTEWTTPLAVCSMAKSKANRTVLCSYEMATHQMVQGVTGYAAGSIRGSNVNFVL